MRAEAGLPPFAVTSGADILRGAAAKLGVDHVLRSSTRRNHSATHLLHWALRQVVGETAAQKGSLVGPNRLRFDYSATRPLGPREIEQIENLVNASVLENTEITTDALPMDEAKRRGAIGIFEEKYGEVVRMLTIGPSIAKIWKKAFPNSGRLYRVLPRGIPNTLIMITLGAALSGAFTPTVVGLITFSANRISPLNPNACPFTSPCAELNTTVLTLEPAPAVPPDRRARR